MEDNVTPDDLARWKALAEEPKEHRHGFTVDTTCDCGIYLSDLVRREAGVVRELRRALSTLIAEVERLTRILDERECVEVGCPAFSRAAEMWQGLVAEAREDVARLADALHEADVDSRGR